jgi:transcriptional regulator with XRE-family HTH domain
MDSKQSRAARGLLKWSQRQLADESGVGLSTVAEFENDKRDPWADNLAAIRNAFEKAGVIFEGDGKFVGVKLKIRRGK